MEEITPRKPVLVVEPRKPVIVVQGGQWGSEAKGLVTHKLTMEKRVDVAIRTGTINAGHTVYHEGRPYAMQQIPVSWVRSECNLMLGPGAYIHPATLVREIEWIADATHKTFEQVLNRLFIDHRCGLHLDGHTQAAQAADRHHSIGTTGKGCSVAVTAKINGRDRSPGSLPLFTSWIAQHNGFWSQIGRRITDTVLLGNMALDRGKQLLVEGTQGTMLDLHLGSYPYTTHKQTQATSWLAEAGLSCTLPVDLWLVLRTHPIKVAGNSGPMPKEMSWGKLARRINELQGEERVPDAALREWEAAMRTVRDSHYPEAPAHDPAWWGQEDREAHRVAASEIHKEAFGLLSPRTQDGLCRLFEFTTVTKKLRRIAEWDEAVVDYSLMLNRPTNVALTFMNYKYPELWGAEKYRVKTSSKWRPFVQEVEKQMAAYNSDGRVGMVSFGPAIAHTHMAADLAGAL